jgi:hypothetical protein
MLVSSQPLEVACSGRSILKLAYSYSVTTSHYHRRYVLCTKIVHQEESPSVLAKISACRIENRQSAALIYGVAYNGWPPPHPRALCQRPGPAA